MAGLVPAIHVFLETDLWPGLMVRDATRARLLTMRV
jgi:hypothetical protein